MIDEVWLDAAKAFFAILMIAGGIMGFGAFLCRLVDERRELRKLSLPRRIHSLSELPHVDIPMPAGVKPPRQPCPYCGR